jgi:basic amino acid/polyamine antiporter, APA family
MRRIDLTAVVINGVIGAGIFGLPSKVFALAGTYSLVSFAICAICVFLIVLSFAEASSRFADTGGPYLFARASYGPLAGFIIGWLVWLARVTSFSANCGLLPEYLGFFFPALASGWPRALLITLLIAALTAINVRGVRVVADTGNTFAALKLIPLFLFAGVGFFFVNWGNFSGAPPGYHAFSQSVLLLSYAFTGFEIAVIPAGESRDPRRDLPFALLAGMTVIVAIYVAIQVVSIGTLPGLAGSQRPLADAAAHFMGTRGALLITAGICFSLAGNLNVLILSGSRLIYAMAERRELPARLAAIHPRFRTPAAAVILTTAVMLALTLSGSFVYLVTLSVITRMIAYLATCGAVLVLRRRIGDTAKFHLSGGIAIPVAGMIVIAWMLSSSTWREVAAVAIATLVGLGAYFAGRRVRD